MGHPRGHVLVSFGNRVALIPYDWCHYGHRDTRTRRRPCDNMAEVRERLLQAKESQRPRGNYQELGEHGRHASRPPREPAADLHPGLLPPGRRDNPFLRSLVPTDVRTEPRCPDG